MLLNCLHLHINSELQKLDVQKVEHIFSLFPGGNKWDQNGHILKIAQPLRFHKTNWQRMWSRKVKFQL